MTQHDDTEARDHHVDLDWHPVDGGLVAASSAAEEPTGDDSEHGHGEPSAGLEHPFLALTLILLGAFVLVGAVTAVWFASTVTKKVRVPVLAGLTPPQASAALSAAGLGDGRAYYLVTREFPAGLVLRQVAPAGVAVSQATSVDVGIAMAPVERTVPDVGLAEAGAAQKLVRSQLFVPEVRYAYSKDVATGLVIEQLPRAGDTAVTGSSNLLVVSLGPGSGMMVPSLVGQSLGVARSEVASAALFTQVRLVSDPKVPDGTVVDQAPAAGLFVPVASGVTVSIAISNIPTPTP